jgi:DNA polymerase-1
MPTVPIVAPSRELFEKAKELFVYARSKGKQGRDPLFVVAGTPGFVTILTPKDTDLLAYLSTKPLIGYDLKKSIKTIFNMGIKEVTIAHDIQVAAFLINSLDRALTLEEISAHEHIELSDIADVPNEDIGEFASQYIAGLMVLAEHQKTAIAKLPKLEKLAKEIEWPTISILAKMEQKGVLLDSDYLAKMSSIMEDKISDLEQTIYGFAEEEFNIASPQQLAKVLFENMKLPTKGIKKGKTGYSTAANELEKLRLIHPIIDCISSYREYAKLKNTYVDALPAQVDEDGRVHTTFNLTVAQTGRLSSTDPNLQNIPVRSELGKTIRTAFVADENSVFVSADYSQFELRLAAVLANDHDMIEVFNNGEDIHVRTASEIYGIALEDVTKEQRSAAKTINFGILYGMSPHGLAAATGMSFEEAREFIERYFSTRKPLVDYIESLREEARVKGYVETLYGRVRPTPDVISSNYIVREAAYRQAVNMPIQGTEADIMKLAMKEVDRRLPGDCYQLLQIHDSILVECPAQKQKEIESLLKETMENIAPNLGIKLLVDVHSGKNWGEL